ncbi:hypothetical protein KEJ45_04775 [Candidatus Bathyarchaeota archaeon]|nr:hypothetical protein [Candidatus Bathyarchaeota archaeon]
MNTKKIKKQIKIDLLEMSDSERADIIKKIKENLRQNINEAKLLGYLLQCETVTINGHMVASSEDTLNGLSMTMVK